MEKRENELSKNQEILSAKLMLSIIQKEHDYEHDRSKTVDTRTGTFIAFSGALLVFVASNIKLSKFSINQAMTEVHQIVAYVFFIIFLLLSLVFLLGALGCFIKVISAKEYKRIGLEAFSSKRAPKNATLSEEEISLVFLPQYKEVIEFSSNVNGQKVKWYTNGIRLITASLLFIILTYSVLFFYS